MKPRFPKQLLIWCCTALVALAETTVYFTEISSSLETLTQKGISLRFNSLTATLTGTSTAPLYSPDSSNSAYAATGVAFTVNLTKLASNQDAASLVNVTTSNNLGLRLNGSSVTGDWKGDPYGASCSYSALINNANVRTAADGSQYLTLAASVSANGVQLYDAAGHALLNLGALKSSANSSFSGISFNGNYINNIGIHTGEIDSDGASNLIAGLEDVIINGPTPPEGLYITNAAEFLQRATVPAENDTYLYLAVSSVSVSGTAGDTATLPCSIAGSATLTTAPGQESPAVLSLNHWNNTALRVQEGGALRINKLYALTLSDNSVTDLKMNGSNGSTSDSSPAVSAAYVGKNATLSISDNAGLVQVLNNSATATNAYGEAHAAVYLDAGAELNINGNGGVLFRGNRVLSSAQYKEAYAAALHVGSNATATFKGNASLEVSGNRTEMQQNRAAYGAGFYLGQSARLNISETEGDVLFRGNVVVTSASSSSATGAAVNGAGSSTISLTDNRGEVRFENNSAEANGGAANGAAIYATNLEILNNAAVVFEGNSAYSAKQNAQGGAVYGNSNIRLSGNGTLSFLGNHAVSGYSGTSYKNVGGGAIYKSYNTSDLHITDNGTVLFQGNYTQSGSTSSNTSANGAGGAINMTGDLFISNNDSVIFRDNYEQRGSKIWLRSLYQDTNTSAFSTNGHGRTELSAKAGGTLAFYDSVTIFNNYEADRMAIAINGSTEWVQTNPAGTYPNTFESRFSANGSSGEVIFSGAGAKERLNAIRAAKGLGAASFGEVEASRYFDLQGDTHLLGGRLTVEEDASLYTFGLAVENGSVLALNNATLEIDVDHELGLTLGSGSTLDLRGDRNIIVTTLLTMEDNSFVTLHPDAANTEEAIVSLGLVTVDDSFLHGGVTVTLSGLDTLDTGSYKLITLFDAEGDPTALSTDNITLAGEGADRTRLRWDWNEMTLFYDHEAQWEIIVDNATGNLELTENKTADVYVRDAQHFTLAADLRAGGQANGGIMLENGTAELAEGSSVAGSVTFAGDAAERTLKTQGNAELQQVVLEAAAGANIIHVAGEQLTVNALGGNGDLTKAGSGTLLLRGESALRGDLTLQDGAVDTATMRFSAIGEAGTLSGVSGVAADSTELSGGTGQQMNVELLAAGLSFSLHELVLNDTVIEAQEGVHAVALNNIQLDAGSCLRLNSAETLGTLNGANTVQAAIIPVAAAAENGEAEILHLYSDQLNGFTLAGGSLTLALTDDIWDAVPAAFAVTFNGLQVAEGAAVTYALGGGNVPVGAALRGVEAAQGGVTFLLTAVPEPATASLTLLALSVLCLRRRRTLQR